METIDNAENMVELEKLLGLPEGNATLSYQIRLFAFFSG
jgi:hypothetical protein